VTDRPTTTVASLSEEIAKLSGVDVPALPKGGGLTWFPRRSAVEVAALWPYAGQNGMPSAADLVASMQPVMLRLGGEWFTNPKLFIFAMFQDEGSIRVYTIADASKSPEGEHPPAMRYTLSKAAAIIFAETMSVESFKGLIADEWRSQATDSSSAEIERDSVCVFIDETREEVMADTQKPQYVRDAISRVLTQMKEGIQAEDHLIDDDEDDEDDETQAEPKPSNGPVASAGAGA
jgi:hypothetical protein